MKLEFQVLEMGFRGLNLRAFFYLSVLNIDVYGMKVETDPSGKFDLSGGGWEELRSRIYAFQDNGFRIETKHVEMG